MIFGPKKRKEETAATAPARATAQPSNGPATSTAAVDTAASEKQPLTEEARQRQALANAASAALGQIITVLLRSKGHRQLPIGWLEQIVVPAVSTGQFFLAQVRAKENRASMPVGVVLWASVTPEIDKRLTETMEPTPRLATAEWKSGNIIWLMEAVGEARLMGAMLNRLRTTTWKDRTVKMRVKREDGKLEVKTLGAA